MGKKYILLLLCLLPVLLPGRALAGFGSYSSVMHRVDGFRVYSTALGAQGIKSVAVQSDAKILIGGDFTITRGGTPYRYLARINPDGTLDAGFTPPLSGPVNALALQTDPNNPAGPQRVYAGGGFGLARLHGADGVPDGSFDGGPTQQYTVNVIAVAPDGSSVLVGGTYPGAGGPTPILAQVAEHGAPIWTRSAGTVNAILFQGGRILAGGASLVRLNPDGSLKDSLSIPASLGEIRALAGLPDGKILVAGDSSGTSCLARLQANGDLDHDFNQNLSGLANTVLLQPDGRILVGGDFTLAAPHTYLARLNPDGAPDATPSPGQLNAAVAALALQLDGNILAGGSFTGANGKPRAGLARFYLQGALDDDMPAISLDHGNGSVYAITLQPDGRIDVGGLLVDVQYGSGPLTARSSLARFAQDWSLTGDFATVIPATQPLFMGAPIIFDLTLLPDQSLIAGGYFKTPQPLSLRFDPSGNPHPVPAPNATTVFNSNVQSRGELLALPMGAGVQVVTVQKDGMMYVGGQLLDVTTSPYSNLARFSPDGARDDSFIPAPDVDTPVYSIVLLPGGYVLVGTSEGKVLRLNSDGTLQKDLTPARVNGCFFTYLSTVVVDAQNRILIAGQWGNDDATIIRAKAMRLKNNPGAADDGEVDASFDFEGTTPFAFNALLNGLVLQADGRMLVYGGFLSFKDSTGITRLAPTDFLTRLDQNGVQDTSFDPGWIDMLQLDSDGNSIWTVNLQTDGKVILGGNFSSVNGRGGAGLARFSNNIPGWQDLSVAQSPDGSQQTVTWLRKGGAPELWRVWFEYSPDPYASPPVWTLLGDATRTAQRDGWELEVKQAPPAGLPQGLPLNANGYLRARGYVTGDRGKSIMEAVSLFYLTPQSTVVTVTANPGQGKTYGDPDPVFSYSFTPALAPGDAFTGSLSRAPGESVGTYAIGQGTLALGSGYTLVFAGADFTVSTKPIAVTAQPTAKAYGDSDPALAYSVSPALIPGDSCSGSLSRASGESVGSYAITQGTLSAGTNYSLAFAGANLAITPKTVSVTANAAGKTYGDPDPPLSYGFSPALVGSDGFSGSLSRASGESAGSYAITQGTLSAGANYSLAFAGANLAIAQRPASLIAQPQAKVYGSPDPAPAVTGTGFLAGDLAPGKIVLGATRVAGEDVGNYDITPVVTDSGSALLANYLCTFQHATLTVSKAGQSVLFPALPAKTYGDADFSPGGGSSSGLPVSYTSSDPAVAAVEGGQVRITGAGSAVITALQAGDANHNPSGATTTLTVARATLRVTADDKTRAWETGNPPLTASYAGFVKGENFESAGISGAPVLTTAADAASPVGTYPIAVGAGSLAARNYSFQPVNGSLTVVQSCQVIIFPSPGEKTYGDPPFAIQATACSGLALSFTSSDPGVATVSGNVLTITGAGSAVITASQGGDLNLQAGAAISQTLVVHPSGQSLTFAPLGARTLGDPPFSLNAAASSGLTPSYLSSDPSVAEVNGSTVTLKGAGTTVITAWQAGNSNFNAALPVSQPLVVAEATTPPALTVSTLSSGAVTANPVLNILGVASDALGIASLTVNGADLTDRAALFSCAVLLAAGKNSITVMAQDDEGNRTAQAFDITFDAAAPELSLSAPADNSVTDLPLFALRGTVSSGGSVTASVNGGAAQTLPVSGGSFRGGGSLQPGLNTIVLSAALSGRVSQLKRSVVLAPGKPSIALLEPVQDLRTEDDSITLRGTVGGGGISVALDVAGVSYAPPVQAGAFQQVLPLDHAGVFPVTATVTDADGNTSAAQRNVIRVSRIPGDLDGDGCVDIKDAMAALRISLGMDRADARALAHGDLAPLVNGVPHPDGVIDAGDVLVILRKIVGMVDF